MELSDDIVGNAYLEAAITNHIKVRSTLGGKLATWGGQGFTPVFYLSATSNVLKNSYSKNENKNFAWNIENILTYTNQFGDHNLTVLLGQGSYVDNIGGGLGATLFGLPVTNYQDASFNFDIPQSDRSSYTYDSTHHKLNFFIFTCELRL